MTRFIATRLIRALLSIWAVVTLTFVVLRITGDPILSLVPIDSTPPDVVEYYRRLWGLDRSVFEQYLSYLRGIGLGTMGRSFTDGRDAIGIVAERLPRTFELMGIAFLAMLALGIPAGTLAALNRGNILDRAIMALAVVGYSLPGYLLGILLIWLFAVELQWLPSSGSGRPEHLVLPAATLAFYNAAIVARFTRSGVLEVLGRPHVLAAAAQGWTRTAVIRRDVLPNAAIPLVTVLGFMLASLVGGSIIVEWIFAWPGIGRLLMTSVAGRDLAVVQVLVLVFALATIAGNLLADLAYAFLNPRIRLGHGERS